MFSLFSTLAACIADAPHKAGMADSAHSADSADSGTTATVFERRLRANHSVEEGLNLEDGLVVALDANNESEPAAEHADVNVSLGRFIGLSTYAEGRFCAVGADFETLASVSGDGLCLEPSDWNTNILCGVNMTDSPPVCVGLGFLVRPLVGTERYRMRIVTDDFVADEEFLAGITIEVQRLLP